MLSTSVRSSAGRTLYQGFGRRYFTSSPPNKKKSSQLLWQVGTAAAVVGAYVAVNSAISYSKELDKDDVDQLISDGPGESMVKI